MLLIWTVILLAIALPLFAGDEFTLHDYQELKSQDTDTAHLVLRAMRMQSSMQKYFSVAGRWCESRFNPESGGRIP